MPEERKASYESTKDLQYGAYIANSRFESLERRVNNE